jgi:hypothetical protein
MGRFVIARGFVGGALALAAGVIVTLLLIAAFQYRDEVRNEEAGAREMSTEGRLPASRP